MSIETSYAEWARLRDWYLGPTIRFRQQDSSRFRELDQYLTSTLGPLQPSDVDARQFYATSPWHAAYGLAELQHFSILNISTHWIFRGQALSSWDLIPKLDRLHNPEEINRAIIEIRIFCHLMTMQGLDTLVGSPAPGASFELIHPPETYAPAAQHYGFNTPLLDFTADPAVAVYFASREKEAKELYASIYAYKLPLNNDASHLLNLRLPPPFIERPYLQKGVYLESSVPGNLGEQIPWDLEVRFPIRAENPSFAVIRENIVNVLPESKEMQILLTYARAGVSDFMWENAGELLTPELVEEFSTQYAKKFEYKFSSLFRKITPTNSYIDLYVARFEDMMYWLCYCVDENNRFGVNLDSLRLVTKSNPGLVRMLLGYYRRLMDGPMQHSNVTDHERESKSALIEILENAMREVGLDPMSKPDLSRWFGLNT